MNKWLLLPIILSVLTLITAQAVGAVILTPQDNKAKEDITNSLSKAADHKYSRYDMINASLVGDNSTFVVYNKTGGIVVPPVVCGPGTHEENGQCLPDLPPQCPAGQFYNTTSKECQDNPVTPPDNTTGGGEENITKINLAGDFSGSSVISAMDSKKADMNVALGDLGYKSTLADFKSNWNKLNNHKCIPGNHDQAEDGSAALAKESSAYCGDIWMVKVANGTTLLVAYNTNGNLDTLLGTAQDALMNADFMSGVKNVVLLSHKPCQVHPNAHHGVEGNVKTFCDSFSAKVPSGVALYTIDGHNHEIAKTSDGLHFLAGGGGQSSHRGCGTNNTWDFCKTQSGFLQLEINNDGKIKGTFYNTNGGAIS